MRKNKFWLLLFTILVTVIISDNVYANSACNGSEYACAVCEYSYKSFSFTYTVKSDGYNVSADFSVDGGTYDSDSDTWKIDGYQIKNYASDSKTFINNNKIMCDQAIVVDDAIISENSLFLYGANAGNSCFGVSCVFDVTLDDEYNNGKEVMSPEIANNIKTCNIEVQSNTTNSGFEICTVDFNKKTNTIVSVKCGKSKDYFVDPQNAVETIGNSDFMGDKCPTEKYDEVKLDCNISAHTCKFEGINQSAYPQEPSSGSCCRYKSKNNEYVYFYTLTHSNNSVKTPAVCFGLNCITNNFSGGNAQLINIQNQPGWRIYAEKIDNCSNMPYYIWFKEEDGKTKFYSEHVSGSTKASIDTSETCVSKLTYDSGSDSGIDWDDPIDVNCDGIIGKEMLDFLNKIFRWIQIIAPIFVIIMGGVDFASAVLQDDRDAMKKASSKFIKRLIIAVALFFIPLILSWLLELFNGISGATSSTCGIGE